MPINEFYFLALVCAAFIVFMVALGSNYIQYRRWLKRQPKAGD